MKGSEFNKGFYRGSYWTMVEADKILQLVNNPISFEPVVGELKEGEEKKDYTISRQSETDPDVTLHSNYSYTPKSEPKEESTPDLTDRVNKYVPQYARQFFDVHIQELKNLREQNERLRR